VGVVRPAVGPARSLRSRGGRGVRPTEARSGPVGHGQRASDGCTFGSLHWNPVLRGRYSWGREVFSLVWL